MAMQYSLVNKKTDVDLDLPSLDSRQKDLLNDVLSTSQPLQL